MNLLSVWLNFTIGLNYICIIERKSMKCWIDDEHEVVMRFLTALLASLSHENHQSHIYFLKIVIKNWTSSYQIFGCTSCSECSSSEGYLFRGLQTKGQLTIAQQYTLMRWNNQAPHIRSPDCRSVAVNISKWL